MKIRNGFVSNSSSSSFVIIGKKLTNDEKEILKNRCPEDLREDWPYEHNEIFNLINDGEQGVIYAGYSIAHFDDEQGIDEVYKEIGDINSSPKIKSLREILKWEGPLHLCAGSYAS